MTPHEQAFVSEAREILARYMSKNPILSSYRVLIDYCHATIANSKLERFHVLYLDSKNRLIEDHCAQIGTVNHVNVYPREVIRRALDLNATAMILIHNHPAGDPKPSPADIEMTNKVKDAADIFDIVVHDHLVIGADREFSFRSEGILK